jgi:Chlorophyll A-B binding protein
MHTTQHGRIAMLAIVGLVVAQFVRLPGDIYQGVSVVEAHNAMVEKGPMVQLLFWLSLFELLTAPLVWNMDAKVSL